ncbi:MAG: hypothetical protein C4576_08695 [Desulfobacteraceae bacterium]|nr:MAG: hypothetical protein C4576_08695 [Desulfobacteraceae bacterium]
MASNVSPGWVSEHLMLRQVGGITLTIVAVAAALVERGLTLARPLWRFRHVLCAVRFVFAVSAMRYALCAIRFKG